MEIQKSKDYDRFQYINGNRNLSQRKIETIIQDINEGLNLLPYCPILVYPSGNNYNVVDGQHRLEVSQKTEDFVYYVVTEQLTLKQIAKLNSRGQKWSSRDFLNCYMKLGIQDYIILKEIITQYRINISTAISFLATNGLKDRKKWGQLFQEGEFKVKYHKETEALLQLSHSLFDRYVFYTDRYLIEAVRRIEEKGKCDFEVLKDKISKHPMEMNKQSSIMDYIYNIEKVYNFNKMHRKTIY